MKHLFLGLGIILLGIGMAIMHGPGAGLVAAGMVTCVAAAIKYAADAS